tara:strand:+ start:427 stop:657 length:231 start_codon:yes stop_codon:yes gene_type:complete
MKKYGKTIEEVDTEKMIMCREIVKEILDFGVDEAQKVQIIKLLSCELENIYLMKRIVGTIKSDFKQEDSEKGIIIT